MAHRQQYWMIVIDDFRGSALEDPNPLSMAPLLVVIVIVSHTSLGRRMMVC
jgi:hypothetical protein